MKGKVLKCTAVGFVLGCFACLLFAVALSLRMGTGKFYFVLPALAEGYSSEFGAAAAQIAAFAWFGTACGVAYLLGGNVELPPGRQAAGYLTALTAGMLPLAWAGRWYEHVFVGIFSYLIIIAAISLIFFMIGLVKLRRDINLINREIRDRKGSSYEKI